MLEPDDPGNDLEVNAALNDEPLVIAETDHSIHINDLDKEALKVLYRLRDAGFSGYLVGGGVRDLYLGKKPKDFDISTNARPGQIRKIFRNSRTIGRRFRLVQVYFRGGKVIEVSTLRSQSEYDLKDTDTVLPSNNTFGTLSEDAFRRDLTINSLFYEIENRTIIDYVGGVKDLDEGVIRIVGEPNRRFTRDPVRMMRAVRHAARNGFRIETETWKAIAKHRDKLSMCPPSRIRDELLKDLRSGNSENWARVALKSGILLQLFPMFHDLFVASPGSGNTKLLFSLLHSVDRLWQASSDDGYCLDMPDHFLFAILLLPWGMEKFDLLQQRQKGKAYYQLSREIRDGVDQVFTEAFNLKRMAKEAIVTLLVNLPAITQFEAKKKWPKWLRRKSYFHDCYRFYCLLAEAQGAKTADDSLYILPGNRAGKHQNGGFVNGSGKSKGRRGTRPAFTKRHKGIFGLRKR